MYQINEEKIQAPALLEINQSINQTVYNVLFFMLARVGRLDPQ